MSKIPLKFAELHTSLFLGGKNFGLKLDRAKYAGISLAYDREAGELLVGWKGSDGMHEAIVPTSNVASMTVEKVTGAFTAPAVSVPASPEVHAKQAPAQVQLDALAKPVIKAQVSSPTDHVFSGPGGGQTGQEKPKAKVVL